jgi:DNA polymerase-1
VNDVSNGKPFSGPSGDVLNYMLRSNEVNREDILVTNLVLCYAEDNPPKEAINACRERLLSEISSADTIIAAGVEAVKEFIGAKSISSSRGIEHIKDKKRIIATSNPAAVLYDSDAFPYMVEDFRLALNPPPDPVYPEVKVYDSTAAGKKLLTSLLKTEGIIATDLEGFAQNIECAGFADSPDVAHVITKRAIQANWELFSKVYSAPKDWLWHNGVYDTKLLKQNGINCNIVHDTFPLSYALDERTEGVHGLKFLARTHLGWKNYTPTEIDDYFETGKLPEDPTSFYKYNGYDCAGTFQLFPVLKARAEKDEVWKLYTSLMIPFMNALRDIELRGFHYDHIAAADLNEEIVLPELRRLTREMAKIVGLEFFNPASHKQVSAFAYDTCGLQHTLKSTRKQSYERSFADPIRVEILADRYLALAKYKQPLKQFAELHDNWAEINKQKGTYIEGLIKHVKDDGKLYTTFNPAGTVTGRPSSRNPNFLNITRTGRNIVPAIRTLFKPSFGCVLVQGDYSQAELRVIAKLSKDRELLNIYRDSLRSLHVETATAFYGKDYTKDQYVKSKNINFGVCYGQSAFMFAQMYHMDREEAQAYIDAWFEKFPKVLEWIKATHVEINKMQYLTNPFGRKRRFHLITEENLQDTLREGVNFLPQSTASDFTEYSVVELNAAGVPIINTVYDSIIADVPKKDVEEVSYLMKEVMEKKASELLGWDDIPFRVDISMSEENWGSVEEVELIAA